QKNWAAQNVRPNSIRSNRFRLRCCYPATCNKTKGNCIRVSPSCFEKLLGCLDLECVAAIAFALARFRSCQEEYRLSKNGRFYRLHGGGPPGVVVRVKFHKLKWRLQFFLID